MRRRTSEALAPPSSGSLTRAQRRAGGIFYTPLEIAREVVSRTLDALPGAPAGNTSCAAGAVPLRVLDPACGAGAMLLAARRPDVALFGIDCDEIAVAAARKATGGDIWRGDALFDPRLDELAPFDAIVANPPYVNIRQLAKSRSPAYVRRLRERFRTARGNFDLYIVFFERALELLRDGGRCGMLVPNKWAALDYARPLRKLLLAETTIERVVDLSQRRIFARASVYPQIVVVTKGPPARQHLVSAGTWRGPQHSLSADAIELTATIDVKARVTTRPLGQLCRLSCGTAGFSARRIADALCERGPQCHAAAADFITSGNIDRYAIRLGNIRYLGRVYRRPVLPLDASAVTERQRWLFAGPKIVIAGLSQRLEAAWDERGLALGVQVFAASDFQIDPQLLLAILNSKLLSYLFRTQFAAKRLAGGYMAINKGQLARLPIVVRSLRERDEWRALVALVKAQTTPAAGGPIDAEIDRQVYRLYRLTKAEIAAVEGHFEDLGSRAA